MNISEDERKANIRKAFRMNAYELFDERDEFDKNIDLIEFMCSDDDDEILNKSAEKVESHLGINNSDADLLNDGEDEVFHLAVESSSKHIPENLLFAVKKTEKEILHNKLVAKIRLINGKKGSHFKEKMEDFFYCIEMWPNYAIEILLSKTFCYQERLSLATFFYGNGLRDGAFAEMILKFYNAHWNHSRERTKRFLQFADLFTYLDQMNSNTDNGPRLRSQYWYYDIESKLTLFFDGTIRLKNGNKRKFVENKY